MKDVKGFEGKYAVTEDGRVWAYAKRTRKARWMKQTITNSGKGYCRVDLFDGAGKRKGALVHRLVAEAYIPNPNDYPFINHKNADTRDNRVENLEWCTQAMNVKHAWDNGLSKVPSLSGEDHPMSKISVSDVKEIKMLSKQGMSDINIGKTLGFSRSLVKAITKGITWKGVV